MAKNRLGINQRIGKKADLARAETRRAIDGAYARLREIRRKKARK